MGFGEGFRAAAVDRRADVEHHHIGVAAMLRQPLRGHQRFQITGAGRNGHKGNRDQEAN
jgi:hypothetical protein